MVNKRIFLCDILNETELKFAIRRNSNCVICNEVDLSFPLPESIEIINAEVYRIEGTWLAYEYNKKIVESLLSGKKKYFFIKGYDISKAINKMVYWTNYRTGALKYALGNMKGDYVLVRDIPFLPGKWWKEILKYFRLMLLSKRNNRVSKPAQSGQGINGRIGILVNNEFELKFYRHIIERLNSKGLILFHYGNISADILEQYASSVPETNLSVLHSGVHPKFTNPFFLSKEELNVLNIVCSEWQNTADELLRYEYIRSCGIRKLLINVGENLPLRNLMKSVFGNDIMVYNTMNGMKSGEAHDSDIFFDKWFIWDERMKEILTGKCGIAEDKMIVCGHLAQDQIAHYTYHNSIGIKDIELEKIVISVFSVRGKRKEKKETFAVLYDFIKSHPEYLLLVKPHPLEKESDYVLPITGTENVIFIPEKLKNSKEALYDQLLISDLSIVFGSTVALESSWMGVPCISIEYRDQSFIYSAGQADITHLKSVDELRNILLKTSKKKKDKPISTADVADKTVLELLS